MPMPRPLSGLPRYLNPVLRPLAGRLPPLAVLHHRGRRSGRMYSTPVQAYRTRDGYIVGLAYDRNAAWALNVLAAGGGQMTRAGRTFDITSPRRRGPAVLDRLPGWARATMRAIDVQDDLEFDASPAPSPRSPAQ